MRDLGAKMAELKFEAPLAKFEETDDWTSSVACDYISNGDSNLKDLTAIKQDSKIRSLEEAVRDANVSKSGSIDEKSSMVDNNSKCNLSNNMVRSNEFCLDVGLAPGDEGTDKLSGAENTVDNFNETFGGSLEDLVNTFDDKIIKCFGNYEENVEDLAPVQVRSQEEIMNECQMWWTITGNFGNILPIDWSKSFTRQMHIPTLKLEENDPKDSEGKSLRKRRTLTDEINELTSEDEAVAHDLDMHSLILNGLNCDHEVPIKSVEEVIKEIDDIIDQADQRSDEEVENGELEVMEKAKGVLGAPLYADKLQYLSLAQLNELYMEMEVLIQELSETLINELASRDELEFEKELKNSFISILLAVQNKRRQYHVEKKRGKFQGSEPKYLTTVIPYHLEYGTPNNQSLQVLIKILKAINEDSPTVPTLLTDYILKVLCPT